ncbi:hypothetical protein [Nonomuraea rosea]
MTKPAAQSRLDSALAVRRVGRSTMVQMCDLSDTEDLLTMDARSWLNLLHAIRRDCLHPKRDGDYVYIEVESSAGGTAVLCTTAEAYVQFQKAAAAERFDGLRPAAVGLGHGPWIWAAGTVEEAKNKALDGVS